MSDETQLGRTRSAASEQGLVGAADAFSRFGYEGASIEVLMQAMGISRASFDAAFGDKRGLFLRVVERQAEELIAAYEEAFERGRSLRAALVAFFDKAVEVHLRRARVPGCLIANVALSEVLRDDAIGELTRRYLALCDQRVAKWIRDKRRGKGMLGSEASAELANGVVRDIALRARAGESEQRLRELAHHAAIALARVAEDSGPRR
ncbi:MAG: TetR/AcrR family transcriptional regulator [Myxococcales bacterium]|nr:TetR/AcrR family transcriptional regulator [Myxococcales bacterium]